MDHGLGPPAYPAVLNCLLLSSLLPFFRPRFFPSRGAGVWSHYFQIATARSHVAKTSFSLLSGSFKDSLKIAPRVPDPSPAWPRDVTHRDSRSLVFSSSTYIRIKPPEKAISLQQQTRRQPKLNKGGVFPFKTLSFHSSQSSPLFARTGSFRAYHFPSLPGLLNLPSPWPTVVSATSSGHPT